MFRPTPQHILSLITPVTLGMERLWLVQSDTSAGRVLAKEWNMAALSRSLPNNGGTNWGL